MFVRQHPKIHWINSSSCMLELESPMLACECVVENVKRFETDNLRRHCENVNILAADWVELNEYTEWGIVRRLFVRNATEKDVQNCEGYDNK